MNVVTDLDGVLRDLNGHLALHYGVPEPRQWDWEYEGRNIYDWCEKDRGRILKEAEETEYFDVILHHLGKPEIWTNQPPLWRKPTQHWLKQHIYLCTVHYLNNAQKRIRLDQEKETWLIEDSPQFTHYDRIILIDRPYNRTVNADVRVRTPKQLAKILRNLLT